MPTAWPTALASSTSISAALALTILLTACSTPQPVSGVPAFCKALGPLLREYSPEEKAELLRLVGSHSGVRKAVETAAGVRVLHTESCLP